MRNIKKICLFSGKRGGLGAYVSLMKLIEADPNLELQILLGDMHVSPLFGETVNEARKFFPHTKIELIDMETGRGDTPQIRTENLATCLHKTVSVLERFKPDIVFVHADRGEHLMVAFAALNLGIPIAHTQGGEVSGNIDEVQRHAITKIAHLHFPETELTAKRIRLLGEEQWRIFTVGSLYIDRIVKKLYTPTIEAKQKAGLNEKDEYFIVLYHPETYVSSDNNYQHMKNILNAVASTGYKSIVTYPCSDPGYEGILKAINEVKDNSQFIIHKNIESLDYLGLIAGAKVLVGNSSGAFVEAPYFKLPAVNIGNRQVGRQRDKNIVDAKPTITSIREAISYVLSNLEFQTQLENCGHIFGDGRASEKILEIIKSIPLDDKLLNKRLTY